MIAKILVVIALIGAISCADKEPEVKPVLQPGKPGDVHHNGQFIPLPQQVPGPKAPVRRSAEQPATLAAKDAPKPEILLPKQPSLLTRPALTKEAPKPAVKA